jgi:hypothetical protein
LLLTRLMTSRAPTLAAAGDHRRFEAADVAGEGSVDHEVGDRAPRDVGEQ